MSLLPQSTEVVHRQLAGEGSSLHCALSHAQAQKRKAMYHALPWLCGWTGLSWAVHFQRWRPHIIRG